MAHRYGERARHAERPPMGQMYLINYESVQLFGYGESFALSLRSDTDLV